MNTIDGVPVDLQALTAALRALTKTLKSLPKADPTVSIVTVEREDGRYAVILVKRTYKVERGRCVLAPPEEQNPICFEEIPYAELEPPMISPIIAADESMGWKPLTDLIIQGSAYAYDTKTRKTTASVRFGNVERNIVVHGPRHGDFDAMGRPCFSEAEPFEEVPLRWDKAYGGFDLIAFKRRGVPWLNSTNPKPDFHPLAVTPYHYPRNPCGSGYLLEQDEESFYGLRIPQLEHPSSRVTPERIAVKTPDGWMRGPLPASWDFQPITFFPRCAYLGLPPSYEKETCPPAEIELGYAPKDLLAITPVMKAQTAADVRLEMALSAAPGMSFSHIEPNEVFELRNVRKGKPLYSIELPGEVPKIMVELRANEVVEPEPRLNHVVLRVDLDEVELLWSARFRISSDMTDDALLHARRVITWSRPRERA
jgi:hypothetical protein